MSKYGFHSIDDMETRKAILSWLEYQLREEKEVGGVGFRIKTPIMARMEYETLIQLSQDIQAFFQQMMFGGVNVPVGSAYTLSDRVAASYGIFGNVFRFPEFTYVDAVTIEYADEPENDEKYYLLWDSRDRAWLMYNEFEDGPSENALAVFNCRTRQDLELERVYLNCLVGKRKK